SATSTDADFGTNSWLVEEMYEQFREDPLSVGEAWREFFADYKSSNPALQAHASAPTAEERDERDERDVAAPAANGAPAAAPSAPASPAAPTAPATPATAARPQPAPEAEPGSVIRGVGATIAANMARSLSVPTATSFRNVPAKLLEVN